MTWFVDPQKRGWKSTPLFPGASAFHSTMTGYAVTPLLELKSIAVELGVDRLFVKDESSRLGLPAFKILGVSWAVNRIVSDLVGGPPSSSFDALRQSATSIGSPELVTATDGNHGRALARIATMLGLRSHVVVPSGLPPAVTAAIEHEGAVVVQVAGSYDDAVAIASKRAIATGSILVQDMAWDGYEDIPRWIVEGYSTLAIELEAQLAELELAPSLIAVPTGVGSLLQAVVTHFRSGSSGTSILSVEPDTAACVLASLEAGSLQSVHTTGTIMAGLNCGTPSSLAWPVVQHGLDAAVAVTDADAILAMRDLQALGISSGPCGAAALAGVRSALSSRQRRTALAIDRSSVVVLISTEGLASGSAGTGPMQ